ncbi:ABC transporter branched-chain amino acid permease [Acidisphaera rubrifaciens HS-AP3]|uniref:ABC transporter branched-chain amino acid permease n=1 Tax=Acidisphaera rubrifaciens HS-AP3 TaxID=1231350 RepID=A0A0D6P3B1_9PROT|nr:ABC transporter branched-chain amino acid permease [Acidisphaera rubrifaciens HS-AP3]
MQTLSRRVLLAAAPVTIALSSRIARAAPRPRLRIGVLNDESGPYRDLTGMTSVACARQAVQDFGDHGFDVDILYADHQNKPDVGASIARQWIDNDGVDVIADVPTSSVALAVSQVCREKDKLHLNASATAVALTGKQCNANTIVWSFDTYMMAVSSGGAMVRAGGKTWFFITADYAFGHSLEDQTSNVVRAAGGKVLGSVRYPFPDTTDFSSFISQAMSSGANVLGLANAGADSVNCMKQAHEFGLRKSGMRLAPMLSFITDIHALGLDVAQGITLTESFYWNLNDRTRAFAKRLQPKMGNFMPNQAQASAYSSVLHYLKVAAAMGPAEAKRSGAATVARMKAMPTDDDAFGPGKIRIDGRGLFPAYLFRVKTPAESRGEWDLYDLVATTPADQTAVPLSESACPLVKA